MAETGLAACTAFADALPPGRFGALGAEAGVIAGERPWAGAASLSARPEAVPDAAAALAALGLTLPQPRRCAAAAGAGAGWQVFWLGPERWLVAGPADAPARLGAALAGQADVVPLSDAWAVLHLRGTAVREVLARIVPIDLHPRAFGVGDVAATRSGGMPLLVWRSDATGFGLAVARSYAGSLGRWLMQTALPFGLLVEP